MASGSQSGGESVGHYRILRRLGGGGMGEVFLAHDSLLNRDVALKFLNEVRPERTKFEALLNEARAASRLDHSNIGTIFGLEQTASGQPFMVMAYYDGQTLYQRLRRGPIDFQEATAIALQAARGLAAAHAERVIHGDIKPSNLILTQDGTLKIVDFGIAKAGYSDVTQTMSISGTVAYMAPEQAQGVLTDHRADIWALGVVIAEMLTGKSVFERESHPATLYAIVHNPVPPLPANAPAALQSVVYRALAKDPAHRYQSCGELVHDLSAVTSPISSRRLSLYRRLASGTALGRLASWPKVAALAGILIAALALSFTLFGDRWRSRPAPHLMALPMTVTGDDQALADGLLETITSRLSNFQSDNPDLWIVPISEVRHYKVTDPAMAHKLLNANLAIACSLSRQGRSVHLLVILIDTASLRQIGAGEFMSDSSDLSELENQAVQRIAALMRLKGSAADAATKIAQSSSYEAYLKAVGLIQRYDRAGNLDIAITLLKQVTAIDSHFALAFAALGQAYRTKASLTKDQTFLPLADSAVTKAISLDDNSAEIHMVMGSVQRDLGHIELALAEYRRALQLEPRNADALGGMARIFSTQERYADAENLYRQAASLRPEYWQGYNDLGAFFKSRRRYEEAAAQFKRVIQLTPSSLAGYSNLAATYIDARNLSEAEQAMEKAVEISPTYEVYANLGVLAAMRHEYRAAAEATEHALKLNDKDWLVWLDLGVDYQWFQDTPRATAAYKRAISLLESNFALHSLQPDSRAEYAEMLAFIGDAQKARTQFDAALAVASDNVDVLLSGAGLYTVLGESDRARQFANKAVSKGLTLDQLKADPNVQWLLADSKFVKPSQ